MESTLDSSADGKQALHVRNRVRELRSSQELSQGKLGAALGVSRQTINAIEAGRYTPSLPLALSLARFFGITVEEMFYVDESWARD